MKKALAAASVVLAIVCVPAPALAAAWAQESTQIINMIQLVMQYAKQIEQYSEQVEQTAQQVRQTEAMMQNLRDNRFGTISPELSRIAQNIARVKAMGTDIASNIALVDRQFAETFKNPEVAGFAEKFKLWTDVSQQGLHAAMLNAGLQREQFADDATSLQALVQSVSAADGNLAALKALGSLSSRQIHESMKLRDLVSQQQVAMNRHLAAQAAKEQATYDVQSNTWIVEDKPLPKPRPKKPGQF